MDVGPLSLPRGHEVIETEVCQTAYILFVLSVMITYTRAMYLQCGFFCDIDRVQDFT